MALAKKCDRCGILYEHYSSGNSKYNWNGLRYVDVDSKGTVRMQSSYIDLCPECMHGLTHYLNYETEEKQNDKD